MEKIISKITRDRLYNKFYEPSEMCFVERVAEDNEEEFYDAAVKLLAKMNLSEGEGY